MNNAKFEMMAVALLCFIAPACAQISTAHLGYSDPKTFSAGSKSTALTDDFQCGIDGSLFLQAYETSGDSGGFVLLKLGSAGETVSFQSPTIASYGRVSMPRRFFATASKVYALVRANKLDSGDPQKISGFSRFVLVYDYQGQLLDTVVIEPGLDPLSMAAFASGNVLLVTQDKFNKDVHLIVLDKSGRRQSELSLLDENYRREVKSRDGETNRDLNVDQYIGRMLAEAQFVPDGDNLLVIPKLTAYPIMEISERGVVKSVHLSLPKGKSTQSFLPGAGATWLVRTGSSEEKPYQDASTPMTFMSDATISEFDFTDGHLLRRIEAVPGLTPVCKTGEDIVFLGTREEDGRLQLVTGSPSR